MTETQYGMPKLGQLAKLLRDTITDELLLTKTNGKTTETITKHWDRYCSETSNDGGPVKDYIDYAWLDSENEIPHLFIKYCDSEKALPDFFPVFIFKFFISFYESLKSFNPYPENKDGRKYPLIAENSTENYVLFNFSINLFEFLKKLEDDYGIQKSREFISIYLDKLNYKNLLSEILKKENLKNNIFEFLEKDKGTYEKTINHLEKKSEINKEDLYKIFNTLSPNSAKNRIRDVECKDSNFTWQEIQKFCFFISDEMEQRFKLTFFLKNFEQALKNDLFQTEKTILKIKANLKKYAGSDITAEDFLVIMLKNLGDIYLGQECGEASGMLNKACNIIFDKHIYKQNDKVTFEKFIDSFKEFAPHSSAFFIPWFKAYTCVARLEYDRAMEYYKEAFQNKYLAGDYLVYFLEQAFCFANYYKCDWTSTRKAYKNDGGIKNPVQCDPKMFKNFGYAIGVFQDSAENSFMETYHSFEYFYHFFPVECFYDKEAAVLRKETELKNRSEIKIEAGNEEAQNFVNNPPFDVLASLKDKNKLITEKSLFTLNKDHNSKQKDLCSPLYLCIKHGSGDERLLDLAKAWIENDENIDISAVSYNGETPLLRAFKEYNQVKYNPQISLSIKEKLFTLCRILTNKCTWENELKFGSKIQTLKEAIDTCDFETVKALTDKIPIDEFSDYKLGKVTPLIYAIKRKEISSYGFAEYTRKQKDIHIPHALPDSFGLTRNEKMDNYLYHNPLPQDLDYTKYHMEHWENQTSDEEYINFISLFGEESDWEEQERGLEKIISYFIERLKNPDSQYSKQSSVSSDGQTELFLNTPLVISAQCNDIFTANILIDKGACLSPEFDEAGIYKDNFDEKDFSLVNNFIYNLILYKSWDTLSWFLENRKELASKLMRNDEFNMNPLVFFAVKTRDYFIWTGKDKIEWRPVVQHIVNLFISCGADPDENTVLGTARDLMSFYEIKM